MQYLQYKDNILPGVSTILISLIVILVLWYDIFLPGNISSGEALIIGDSPLAIFLNGKIPFHDWTGNIASLVCMIITAYCMISLNDTFAFINVRTILPALIFAITVSLLMRPHAFSPAWIIGLCSVLFVNSSFKLIEGSPDKFIIRAFDAGLFLSFATLFSAQTIILVLPFLVLQYRCHTLTIKLFFSFLTGLIMPYFYCVLIAAATNNLEIWTSYWSNWFDFGVSFLSRNGYEKIIYIAIIGILFIFSFLHFLQLRSSQNIRSREEVIFLIVCFISTLVMMLMNNGNAPLVLPACLFFCGFIIGQFFTLEWSLLSKILMAIFAISSILYFVQPNLI